MLVNNNPMNDQAENQNRFHTIDDVYDKSGYGTKQFKMILILVLTCFIEGMHLTIFSSMIIPLKRFFNLDDSMLVVLAISTFIGLALGSLLTGKIGELMGRKLSIRLMLVVISIMFLITSLASRLLAFAISRFAIGFCVSVLNNQIHIAVVESLPNYNRGLVMCLSTIGYPVGQILPNVLIYLIMPNFETSMIRTVFLFCFGANFLISCGIFFSLEENPRLLLLSDSQEDQAKGFEILDSMVINTTAQLSLPEKGSILRNLRAANFKYDSRISSLYDYNFRLSMLLASLWFISGIMNYGPISILSLTIAQQHKHSENKTIVLDQLIVMLYFIPFRFLAGYMNELQVVGRVKVVLIGFFSIFIASVIWFISIDWIMYSFLFISLAHPFYNSIKLYTLEAYPAKLRESAFGFMYFTERVACILSQGFILLQSVGVKWPPVFLMALAVLCSVLTMCLPFDTTGCQLENNYCELGDKSEELRNERDRECSVSSESTLTSEEKNLLNRLA